MFRCLMRLFWSEIARHLNLYINIVFMIKKLLEFTILAIALVLLLRYGRKTAAKYIILIMPFSFSLDWGATNTYIITLVTICDYIISFLHKRAAGICSYSAKAFLSLFVIVNIASLLFNIDHLDFGGRAFSSTHIIAIANIVSCVLLFIFIVRSIQTEADIVSFIRFSLFAYLICSVMSIFQLLNPAALQIAQEYFSVLSLDTVERGVRVMGTIGSFELYAEYSGIIFLVSLYFGLTEKEWSLKAFWAGICIYCVFLLFMTKTRGGVIALGVAMLYLLIIQVRNIGGKRALALVSAGIGSFVIIYTLISGDKYNVISSLLANTEINVSQGQFDSRSLTWAYGIKVISEMGFMESMIGKGPGLKSGTSLLEMFPHSLYIYLVISLGVIGLSLYIAWFLWLGMPRIRTYGLDKKQVLLRVFIKSILILIVIDQIKIEYIRVQDSSYAQILWLFYALSYVSLHKQARTISRKVIWQAPS